MKIAIVIERYNPLRGGAERSSMEMASALAALGHCVSIIAGRVEIGDNIPQPVGVDIIDLQVKAARSLWFSIFDRTLCEYLKSHSFDIVHSITPVSNMDVYQPRAGSQLHALNRHIEQYRGLKRLWKRVTSNCNRARVLRLKAEGSLCRNHNGPTIAVLSNYVARQFVNDYKVSESRLCLIRNAINVQRFQNESVAASAHALRNRFDPDNKLALIVHVSEDPDRKGLSELISAMALVCKQQPSDARPVRLLAVGSYDYTRYYQQVRKLGLDGSVVFFGPTREIPAMMKMADALILPTWDDACSRVVMEALVAGTPAVSTAYNGASELFAQGKYGIEINSPADLSQLADAINDIAKPAQTEQFKNALASSDLHESLSMARHARELIDLYNSILQKR
ncbi:MAG: glycosyltransferase family 4 protein [Sedimentisphaerales bacterium]|nr:glycosyltransferase family 4 protein [Sedimentisphaerales bacterium]MBN2843947.1 glycosyltransferase family 4 protein [Sedimentisphaerales bacterium]